MKVSFKEIALKEDFNLVAMHSAPPKKVRHDSLPDTSIMNTSK